MKISPKQRTIGLWFVLVLVLIATAAMAQEPRMIAAIFVQGKVGLKWTTVPGVTEYTVYRKASGEDFQALTTVPTGQWFDEQVSPGTTYSYRIGCQVDGSEVFSGEKNVSIPAAVTGFKAPVWVGARVEGPRIMLNWEPVPSSVAYNIFRSMAPGGPYESIASSQSNRYADTADLEAGAIYYYVLTALNAEFEETPQSLEHEIKFGLSAEEVAAANESKIELTPLALTQQADIVRPEQQPMNQPSDIYIAPSGDIYVCDALNAQIHCFDNGGEYKFSFGRKADVVEGRISPNGSFSLPLTLCISSSGDVYVADVAREDIQAFSADGTFLRVIKVDNPEGMAGFRANGMHVFDDGTMVATDTGNHRVFFLDANGAVTKTVGKRGSGDGEFNYPSEIDVNDQDEIFIVDIQNNRVQVLDRQGNFLRAFGHGGRSAGTFARPSGIAVDVEGNVWVTDKMSGMVQKFDSDGEIVSAVGTNEDEFRFGSPHGIFLTETTLYVVDRLGNKVGVFAMQ